MERLPAEYHAAFAALVLRWLREQLIANGTVAIVQEGAGGLAQYVPVQLSWDEAELGRRFAAWYHSQGVTT